MINKLEIYSIHFIYFEFSRTFRSWLEKDLAVTFRGEETDMLCIYYPRTKYQNLNHLYSHTLKHNQTPIKTYCTVELKGFKCSKPILK